MFKFVDVVQDTIWIKPDSIEAVEHIKTDQSHVVRITTGKYEWEYAPTSEEDCRSFLFSLFKSMGEDYKYE